MRIPQGFADSINLKSKKEKLFLHESGEDPLFHRGFTHHAMEALLWARAPNGDCEDSKRLLLLQAHMMISHMAILEVEYKAVETPGKAIPKEEVFKSLYVPCMFARKFARDDWSKALSALPPFADMDSYIDTLDGLGTALSRSKSTLWMDIPREELMQALAGISFFIKRATFGKEYHKRIHKNAGSTGVGHNNISGSGSGSSGSDDENRNGVFEFSLTKGNATLKQELDAIGEAPEDHLPHRSFLLTHGGAIAAEHVLAVKARENQKLPRGYSEPQPSECLQLICAMRANPKWFANLREAKEITAWTESLFFLSCSPRQATELSVGFAETPLDQCDFMLRLADGASGDDEFPPRFRVRAIEPPYRTQYVPIEGERSREDYFEIADLGGVFRSVREYVDALTADEQRPEAFFKGIENASLKIFSRTEQEYSSIVNRFSASIGLGDRVTSSGLGKVLAQRYIEQGDEVSSALLSCSEPSLASVRRWYFTPKTEQLRIVHKLGFESLWSGLPPKVVQRTFQPILEASETCVGSRRCADFGYIKQLVSHLQSAVTESCANRTVAQRRQVFCRRHNALTMLSVWALNLSVGMRSTMHLYLHPSEYDRVTGMGTFVDKGQQKARPYRLSKYAMEIAAEYDGYSSAAAVARSSLWIRETAKNCRN